ncbi:polar-differentiation response regulator DivK [Comamonadaceae bacterium OS-1]|nr:polar-differentiation response regulator DivK [Comamonadaceae bacterium OS-1]
MPARILVIEDDEFSRELVRYLLDRQGYTVLEAADGGAGVQMALIEHPDLVLCDLQMPVLNGYEVVQRLRGNPLWRAVPVVAVTAFSMPGDRDIALATGFDHYLTKPITPEIFVEQIAAFLPPGLRASSPPGA